MNKDLTDVIDIYLMAKHWVLLRQKKTTNIIKKNELFNKHCDL